MQRTVLLTLVLGISSILAQNVTRPAFNRQVTRGANSGEGVVGPDSCFLPCTVILSGVTSSFPYELLMHVEWSASLGASHSSSNFRSLSDPYWVTEKIYFSASYPRCTAVRRYDDNLELDCGLTIGSCSDNDDQLKVFDGLYRCYVEDRVTRDFASVTSEIVRPAIGILPGPNPDRDGDLTCFHPTAEGIRASVFTDSGNMERLNITWSATSKPRDNDLEYCDGSRKWKVRVLVFDSLEGLNDEDSQLENDLVRFAPTSRLRETHFEWKQALRRDKYYVFQIKHIIPESGDVGTRPVIYTSFIHYFGEQIRPYFDDVSEEVITVEEGGDVIIECAAGGLPPPDVRLVYQGSNVKLSNNRFRLRGAGEDNIGDYFCSASNILVNPPFGKRRHTANKQISIKLRAPQFLPTEKNCVFYTGAVCRNFLHSDTKIFTNTSAMTADSLESAISNHMATINFLSADHRYNLNSPAYTTAGITEEDVDKCYNFLRGVACNLVYPYCHAGVNVPRPICKHSCDVLGEGGACGFYLDADLLPESGDQLREFKRALLAGCDDRVNPAGSSPECIYISHQSPTVDGVGDQIKQSFCVKGKGRGYSGRDVYRTESGTPCQSWSSQTPHTHSVKPAHFSVELFNAGAACRNPGGLGERPWCYTSTLDSGKRWEYCDAPQCEVCEEYGMKFCSSLPGYQERRVFIDREDWGILTMEGIESHMVGLFHSLEGDSLSLGCQLALRSIICHGSLPFCKTEGDPSPLKLCSDHCALFDEMTLHCPSNVVETIRSHWNSSAITRLLAPDCSLKAGRAECLPAPERLTGQAAMNEKDCYNSSDHGLSYNGAVSETVSGAECETWATAETSFTAEHYPELAGVTNHCRNPGQWQKVPWCFTAQGDVELCAVDSCASVEGATEKSSGGQSSDSSNTVAAIFAVVLVAVVVVVTVIVGSVLGCKYSKRRTLASSPLQLKMIPSSNDNVRNMKFKENNQYNMLTLTQPLPPKVVETILSFHQVPQESIEYVKQLGQGFFGMVFKGRMKPMCEGEEETLVAVKTLKEDSNDGTEAFVNEAKLMFGFDHANIVKILGVSMTKTPYYLIFEYMDKGDLTKFLRENASSLQRRYMNPTDRPRSRTESTLSDDPASLNSEQLTDICKQIASGMEYLSSMKHVHRDLACRNCLVKSVPVDDSSTPSGVIVKIGDFGLSHNLYSKDYYRVRGQAVLPIRWMSPEAIIYGKFSTAGDVWSFGVVMWEIFTFGMQPYYGTSNEEVMERVRHGKVLTKPTDCSARMYTIMTECWQKDDLARPSFTEILMYLDECRVSVSSEDAQSIYSDCSSDAFLEENSDPETEERGD